MKFAAIGDFGDASSDEQDVADLVDSKGVDFIITTGDNSYGGSASGTEALEAHVGPYYGSYIGAPTGTDPNHFFPSLGNHDYSDGGGITAYETYFNLPGAGITSPGASGTERYYDFVQGPVHFFALDSNPTSAGSGADDLNRFPDETQGLWLQAQLAASTSPWKIVYFHHPPYSSATTHGTSEDTQYGIDGHGAMKDWPFEDWGVTAVMNGHDHVYERIMKDENGDSVYLPYFVTGAGGKSLYTFNGTPEPGSASRHAVYGSMIVEADDDSITFEYWSAAGALLDMYTIDSTSTPPDPGWVAYNDMNTEAWDDGPGGTNPGGANPANVTSYTYATSGALKNFATGAGLAGDGDGLVCSGRPARGRDRLQPARQRRSGRSGNGR